MLFREKDYTQPDDKSAMTINAVQWTGENIHEVYDLMQNYSWWDILTLRFIEKLLRYVKISDYVFIQPGNDLVNWDQQNFNQCFERIA